jgi:splicing factor 3B subunit 4
MAHQGFGFCEFLAEPDAEYAVKIMNQIKLYGKPIRVNKASYDKKQLDVGANLFIGSLDEGVDESSLYDTFATFGGIAEQPKVSWSYRRRRGGNMASYLPRWCKQEWTENW